MSVIATTVVRLFAEAEPIVVLHFCDLCIEEKLPGGITAEEMGIISLVYSAIQQLVFQLQPEFGSAADFSEQRFAGLDGSKESLAEAITLLEDLAPLCLPYIIIVIDGLERLDYGEGRSGCGKFLDILRNFTGAHRAAESNCVYKTLFTTSGTPSALMNGLGVKEILLQNAQRNLPSVDRLALGQTPFADLEGFR